MSNYGVFDPEFKYVPAAQTNISKTFARIRRELAEKEKREAESMQNVKQIKERKKA